MAKTFTYKPKVSKARSSLEESARDAANYLGAIEFLQDCPGTKGVVSIVDNNLVIDDNGAVTTVLPGETLVYDNNTLSVEKEDENENINE